VSAPRSSPGWWGQPLRGDRGTRAQTSAEARRREPSAAPEREAARAIAADVIAKHHPDAAGWRVSTNGPKASVGRVRYVARLWMRPARSYAEQVLAETEGTTRAAAFDALVAVLRVMLARAAAQTPRATWPRSAASPFARELATLGLDEVPDLVGLRRAWRTAARKHHPDAGGDPAKFIAARRAYERLEAEVRS